MVYSFICSKAALVGVTDSGGGSGGGSSVTDKNIAKQITKQSVQSKLTNSNLSKANSVRDQP